MTNSQPAYVCIPRRLLLHPPIAHRGSDASARVTPFEFAVLTGILVEARAAASHVGHVKSFAAAGKDIALERTFGDEFDQDWKQTQRRRRHGQPAAAPERYHAWAGEDGPFDHSYKPRMKRAQALKRAGSVAYRRERKKLRRHPVDTTVTVTRYALLRSAGLPNKGGNHRKLAGALDRLCKAVGGGDPPLLDWKEQEDGRLRLEVSRHWLQKPYARLPLPLPRQPTVLAFLLFATAFSGPHFRSNKTSIGFSQLCDRLGVSLQWGSAVANRAVAAALNALNDWLEALKFDRGALAKLKPPITLPASYTMQAVGDDGSGVRLKAHAYHLDERELEEEEPEPTIEEMVEEQMARKERARPARHRLTVTDDDEKLAASARRIGQDCTFARKLEELQENVMRSTAGRARLHGTMQRQQRGRITRRRLEVPHDE
jgi:hypothetical protein